jgi:hypothetical protein
VAEEQLFRILGSEGMVCLPLVANQRCLGVLIGGVAAWQMPSFQKRERFLQSFGGAGRGRAGNGDGERGTPGARSPMWPKNTAKPRAAWCTR